MGYYRTRAPSAAAPARFTLRLPTHGGLPQSALLWRAAVSRINPARDPNPPQTLRTTTMPKWWPYRAFFLSSSQNSVAQLRCETLVAKANTAPMRLYVRPERLSPQRALASRALGICRSRRDADPCCSRSPSSDQNGMELRRASEHADKLRPAGRFEG